MPADQNTVFAWNVGEPPPTAPLQLNFAQRLALRFAGVDLARLVQPAAAPIPPPPPTAPPERARIPDSHPQGAKDLSGWEQSLFFTNRQRLQRYLDYDEMDYGDIASQLDVICDSVLISDDAREQAFKVEIGNRNINKLCQELIETTALQSKVRQFLRAVLKYGDVPVALWFDDAYNIVATQLIEPYHARRRVDRYGRLLGGTDKDHPEHAAAYWQVDYLNSGVGGTERPIASWLPWQMVWLKWRESDRFVYSEGSYIEDMRRDWVKLRYSEASLPIARFSRAYPRRVMYLDVTGQTPDQKKRSVQEFKAQLGLTELHNLDSSGNIIAGTQARNPLSVADDIYIGTAYRNGPDGKLYPQLNSVALEDPRIAGLENIGDLEYQRKKLYRRLSPSLMGEGKPGNDLGPQDMAANRMFSYAAWILEYRLIRPVLSLQCALRGYVLSDKDVTVNFANTTVKSSWRFSDASFRASMSDLNSLAAGTKTVKQLMQENDRITDAEWDTHVAQWKVEQKLRADGVLPPIGKTNTGTDEGGAQTKTGNHKPNDMDQQRKGMNSA